MRAKSKADYNGDHTRLVDVVRASAVFHSIRRFARGVHAIRQDDRIEIFRVKDRVTEPLPNGYRDVLINLKLKEYPMIMELQLHFKDIKGVSRRCCGGEGVWRRC